MGMKADERKGPKAPKKEAREAMMRLLAENITTRINVIFSPDHGGPCLVAMAEREPGEDHTGKSPFTAWSPRPSPFMGWRVVYIHYPDGYLEVFYNSDGKYKTTEAEA
tara:strand:+ start:243 stop:566 length:324 start_codon:yes stop_codon:yes gene_type:complete